MSNQEFNKAQPFQGMRERQVFTVPEVMVRFMCNVHGWMAAYVGVVAHPFFAVTDDDGKFELKGVPPGTYTIEAWHEKFGTQTEKVTIADKQAQTVAFTFKRPVAALRATGPPAPRRPVRATPCALAHPLRAPARGRDAAPRRRRRHGDEHRIRPGGARLADDLRLLDVLVPARQDGRRDLLRARPPADRDDRRAADDRARDLALARRAAPLGASARLVGARRRRSSRASSAASRCCFFLPDAISISHAGLAQIFFCLTVAIALVRLADLARAGAPARRRSRGCGAALVL